MNPDVLADAERLFRKRKWSKVIELLEPLEQVYHENTRFLFLLGTSYLYCGDTGGAYSSLRKAQSLDFRNKEILLSLAAVYIKRGNTEKAIQVYIDILDRYPECKQAKANIALLRSLLKDNSDITANQKIAYRFLPPRGQSFLPLLISILLLGAAILAFFLITGKESNARRSDIASIMLSSSDLENPGGNVTGARLIMTDSEIEKTFEKAKTFFSEYRDDKAIIELNKLLLSNANESIKEKCRTLKKLSNPPTFLTVKDRFAYKDVIKNPLYYDGVSVIWKGAVANLRTGGQAVSFDFLVGYEEAKTLDGVIEVYLPFETLISDGAGIEILGVIRFKNPESQSGIYLEAVSIHILK